MVYRRPRYFEGQLDYPIPGRRKVYNRQPSPQITSQQRNTYVTSYGQCNRYRYTSVVENDLDGLRIGRRATPGRKVNVVIQDYKETGRQLHVSPNRHRTYRRSLVIPSTTSDSFTADTDSFADTSTFDSSGSSGYSSVISSSQYSSETPSAKYPICSRMDAMRVPRHNRCHFQNANQVPMTFRRSHSAQPLVYRPRLVPPRRPETYYVKDTVPCCSGARCRKKICSKTVPLGRPVMRDCGCGCSRSPSRTGSRGPPRPCSRCCDRYPPERRNCAGRCRMSQSHHHCSRCERPLDMSDYEENEAPEEEVYSETVWARADSEVGSSIFEGSIFERPVRQRPPAQGRKVVTGDRTESSDTSSSTEWGLRGREPRRFDRHIQPPTRKMKHALEKWVTDASDATLTTSEFNSDFIHIS